MKCNRMKKRSEKRTEQILSGAVRNSHNPICSRSREPYCSLTHQIEMEKNLCSWNGRDSFHGDASWKQRDEARSQMWTAKAVALLLARMRFQFVRMHYWNCALECNRIEAIRLACPSPYNNFSVWLFALESAPYPLKNRNENLFNSFTVLFVDNISLSPTIVASSRGMINLLQLLRE